MELENCRTPELIPTVSRLDPLMLVVDHDGLIEDRRVSRSSRFPTDVAEARSLRSFLSAPVVREWLRLVRGAINDQRSQAAIVILDGVAHEAVASPRTEGPARSGRPAALLSLMPGVMEGAAQDLVRLTLTSHEWGPLEDLTRCQLDTLRHVSLGLSNMEIAGRIFRTKRAVEWHIRFLHDTLGIRNRERLAMTGRQAGLHCFEDGEWSQVLKTRPARRPATTQPAAAGPMQAA